MQIYLVQYTEPRLIVDIGPEEGESTPRLVVDGIQRPGTFVPTIYGTLFQDTDGQWGLRGLGYGPHTVRIRWQRTTILGIRKGARIDVPDVFVPNPPATLAGPRLWPPQNLLPYLWQAGFATEQQLLNALSIAVGESGLYTKARNWLPSQGFRPGTDVIGVWGPTAAWNVDHSQQGSSDRGLFQVNWYYHKQFTDRQCDDPEIACQTLWTMTGGGKDWRAWGFGAGAEHYSQYWDTAAHGYPALRPLVQAFLATK